MAHDYAFYPGCSFEGAGGYAESLFAVCGVLGIDLPELEEWNCCGATMFKGASSTEGTALAARNFALAVAAGCSEVVVPCNACYATLLAEKAKLKHADGELRQRIARALAATGLELTTAVTVRHVLDVIVEDIGLDVIRERVVQPLSGARLMAYYGCQYSRPHRKGALVEEPENLDRLIEALGAIAVDSSVRLACCGASQMVSHREASLPLVRDILRQARERQVEGILTICPLCHLNLEAYQRAAAKQEGNELRTPVLYFSQAMGLAMDLDRSAVRLNKLLVPPDPQGWGRGTQAA